MPPARFALLLAVVIAAAALTVLVAQMVTPGPVQPLLSVLLMIAAAGAFLVARRR